MKKANKLRMRLSSCTKTEILQILRQLRNYLINYPVKTKKSRESAIKTYNENKSNWENHNTKNPEIIERREKASALITKLFKQGVKFTAETTKTAMSGQVEKIKNTAKYVGTQAKLRKLIYASLKQALNVRQSKT